MKQIAFALALTLGALPAWAAEKLSLSEVSAYLNQLKTVETSFTQVNDDGSLSTGKLWIQRPGKMRFEYDPPESALVVVTAGTVKIDDQKSNQPPEQYPLRKTPLSIILARRVDLGRANMVVGHGFDGTATVVTAQDPENPERGRIDLMFTDNPVELRKWVVHDDAGTRTTVILGALNTGQTLDRQLFTLRRRGSDTR
ncbi:Outer membrane lipoprotein-sorting protein [Cribrihabitans marinus]|uniref:Outer membrane lipoprotein-sorting protein n=1 Tax=Cribrihabitans marinus TaxID=1227549 RepID=A0A1H6XZ44_9RHOB|nr:outer membrane lipoprotein carrier protein LolA [Cribrihabitans marinus]GGH27691.1 outer-membrane lipoprotein carrier protein [Cribrihabitans marinus]SEJ30152.1 Outer membrane lipoprotein-sorting protein [Cribrihabitans marinus]